MTCPFEIAWQGKCGAPTVTDFCAEHIGEKCVECGAQATRECMHAGQFVCGANLCDRCRGVNDQFGHRHPKKKGGGR